MMLSPSLSHASLSPFQAYCDVRRGHLDTVLQALQVPVPLGAGTGEGELLGVGASSGPADAADWVER